MIFIIISIEWVKILLTLSDQVFFLIDFLMDGNMPNLLSRCGFLYSCSLCSLVLFHTLYNMPFQVLNSLKFFQLNKACEKRLKPWKLNFVISEWIKSWLKRRSKGVNIGHNYNNFLLWVQNFISSLCYLLLLLELSASLSTCDWWRVDCFIINIKRSILLSILQKYHNFENFCELWFCIY